MPTPTQNPSYIDRNETQQLGPIKDYAWEVTLKGVEWVEEVEGGKPRPGHIFVIAYVQVKNLGPTIYETVSPGEFQILDANGAAGGSTYLPLTCNGAQHGEIQVAVGGTIEGCVGEEMPTEGKVDLIFSPFYIEGLVPGGYLRFNLRP